MSRKFTTVICEGVTTNGSKEILGDDRNELSFFGMKSLAFTGDFGAATVQIRFYTYNAAGSLVALPDLTDWSFSGTLPGPEKYSFPYSMPFQVVVSGADGSTNFSIYSHKVD